MMYHVLKRNTLSERFTKTQPKLKIKKSCSLNRRACGDLKCTPSIEWKKSSRNLALKGFEAISKSKFSVLRKRF